MWRCSKHLATKAPAKAMQHPNRARTAKSRNRLKSARSKKLARVEQHKKTAKQWNCSASVIQPNVSTHITQQHSTHMFCAVGTADDYDKEKLICGLESFATQFDILDKDRHINAVSAQLAIEKIFEHANKKQKTE